MKFEIFTKSSGRSGRADIFEGITTWNAVRIIQKEDGMKLNADDPTFATTKVVTLPSNHKGWIQWLLAGNCRPAQTTSSSGNLKGLVYQFLKMLFRLKTLVPLVVKFFLSPLFCGLYTTERNKYSFF